MAWPYSSLTDDPRLGDEREPSSLGRRAGWTSCDAETRVISIDVSLKVSDGGVEGGTDA
jgi:hypothetical protein